MYKIKNLKIKNLKNKAGKLLFNIGYWTSIVVPVITGAIATVALFPFSIVASIITCIISSSVNAVWFYVSREILRDIKKYGETVVNIPILNAN